jgi:hypothetical protein
VPARRSTFPGTNGPLVFGVGATLVTANADGTNRKTVVPTQSNFSAYEPAWSADGTKIAFANKQANTGGIMYVNADGTGITRVTSDVNDGEPTWSPDGTKLAYIHVSTGRRRLAISNLDGTGLTVLTPTLERTLDDPEWSPDGSRIAFSDFADIWVVNVDGSNLRNLTSGPSEPARADNPSWSPDGTRIAYTYAITSVKTIAPDGTGSTTVVANLGEVWEISWSPDGTKIAIANDARGPLQEELFVVNADGSGLTQPGVDLGTTLDWGKAAAVAPPAVPPPAVGVNVNVTPVSGVVRVRLPGTSGFVDVSALRSLPVGSEVDATRGRIRLVSAATGGTQTADFYQGRAIVSQSRSAPLTTLTLSEPLTCPKRKSATAGAKKVRRLWGNGKGLFRTQAKYASATVRGTIWLTEDRCTSTLIRVRAGRVEVFDRRLGRRVTIRAGQSYVARAR